MKTYELADLFALVAKLLAPFVDALRAEFATRRHLSESQRGTVAASISNMQRGNQPDSKCRNSDICPPPVSATEAAKMLNVHRDTVVTAKRVQRDGIPELVEQVRAGELSLHAAEVMPVVEAQADATPEPLYVRKPAGKKFRYVVAPPNARGTTFRKRVTGRRTTYEPCL